MEKIVGRHNFAGDISNKNLSGGFNSKILNKILINVNEATFGGNHEQVEFMKKLITEKYIHGEFKGRDAIDFPNYARLIITTNNINFAHVDSDDRRYLILEPSDKYKEDLEFFRGVLDDMHENDGCSHFFNFLQNYDISAWDSYSLPKRIHGLDTLEESLNRDSVKLYVYEMAVMGVVEGKDSKGESIPNIDCSETYAAQGTLARRIIDGAKQVKIFGDDIPVNASIHTIGGFSAHADQAELLAWHQQTGNPKTTFLVHGEEESMNAFEKKIK